MKKFLCILFCLLCIMPGAMAEGEQGEKWLEEKSRELAALTHEIIQHEEYADVFLSNVSAFSQELTALRQIDFTSPIAVRTIWCPEGAVEGMLRFMMPGAIQQEDSPAFHTWMRRRAFSSLANVVVSRYGVNALTLSSIFTVSNAYPQPARVEKPAWVLLEYEGDWGLLVTFDCYDTGVIFASATPLPADALGQLSAVIQEFVALAAP